MWEASTLNHSENERAILFIVPFRMTKQKYLNGEYEGDFVDGKRHGSGTMTYSNGRHIDPLAVFVMSMLTFNR